MICHSFFILSFTFLLFPYLYIYAVSLEIWILLVYMHTFGAFVFVNTEYERFYRYSITCKLVNSRRLRLSRSFKGALCDS